MKLFISESWARHNRRVVTAIVGVVMCGYLLGCSAIRGVNQDNGSPVQQVSSENPFPAGDYWYTSYDEKGDKVSEGRLSITLEMRKINSEDVTQLKGNWELKKVGNQERIGLQDGKGDLSGSIDKGVIILNLNPNISDANVYLRGKIEGQRFHGTWSFNGIAGPVTKGTFEAIKQ